MRQTSFIRFVMNGLFCFFLLHHIVLFIYIENILFCLHLIRENDYLLYNYNYLLKFHFESLFCFESLVKFLSILKCWPKYCNVVIYQMNQNYYIPSKTANHLKILSSPTQFSLDSLWIPYIHKVARNSKNFFSPNTTKKNRF